MEKISLREKAAELDQNRKKRSRRQKVRSGLAALVAVATLYGLLLPAFTMEKPVYCGMEEHTHSDDCYALTCGLEEGEGHYHADGCYEEQRVLACGKEEQEGHVHTSACYEKQRELSCGREESEGHTHSAKCYETERELVCGKDEAEGHTHAQNCYNEAGELICGKEEREGHKHSDACYRETEKLVCSKEESEGHHHSDACYTETEKLICGKEECEAHVHTDACYKTEKVLVCELGEGGQHHHTADCYALVCGKEEHTHTAECHINTRADVENEKTWMLTLPVFKEETAIQRFAAIAVSQLGYRESLDNYQLDGELQRGYTRYGQWYGEPYADWDAMFVQFCLYYAGIRPAALEKDSDAARFLEAFTEKADVQKMMEALVKYECFITEEALIDFIPESGDIIFFKDPATGIVTTGIVYGTDPEKGTVEVIRGNTDDAVRQTKHALDDETILGYGRLPEEILTLDVPEDQTSTELPVVDPLESVQDDRTTEPFVAAMVFEDKTDSVSVLVEAPDGAFPEGTTMELTPVKAEDVMDAVTDVVDQAIVHVEAVDITFYYNGEKIEPALPIRVHMQAIEAVKDAADEPVLVHVDDDGKAEQITPLNPAELQESETSLEPTEPALPESTESQTEADAEPSETEEVIFESESFSVYALVYTVDFHWEVDGKVFEFTLPGGGSASLRDLVEALKVFESTAAAEKDGVQEKDFTIDDFMQDIETVRFSDEDLLKVVQITEKTTAGEIKQRLGLDPVYSDAVTEEQKAEMDAMQFTAPDWALFSMRSFSYDETLTIKMKDGEEWTIRVTDPITETAPGNMTVLPTANTREQGIKMWLFDYDLDHSLDNENNKANTNNNKNDGINNGHALKFLGWGAGNATNNATGINDFTGLDNSGGSNDIRALQGIVKNELEGGYPVLNNGESLAYLFDPKANTEDRTVYGGNREQGNVNGLFEYKDGYYVYDSDEHYAQLNSDHTNFTVYTSTLAQTNRDGNLHNPPRAVGFFPFDTYEHVYNDLKYENDENHYGNNGTLYLNPDGKNGPSGLNHHLGVAMEMDFVIPKGGLDENGNPIQFNFSGDDDMWVFIDDQLVLDIGGLHQPVDGTIDFSTGKATITGKATQAGHTDNTGSNAIVTAQGAQDPRGNNFEFYQALNMPNGGDGKTHTMKIFYMERGGCDSNCMISFNLPLVKGKADVKVAKYDNTETPSKQLAGVKFGLYTDAACTDLLEEVQSDENGILLFENLAIKNDEQKYYLKEKAPLPGYKANDDVYTLEVAEDSTTGKYYFKVMKEGEEIETIGQNPAVPVIYNQEAEPIDLSVEKKWQNQSGTEIPAPKNTSAEFQVKRYFKYEGEEEIPDPTQPCTFRVYRYKENNTPIQVGSDYTFKGGTTVEVNWRYSNGYYNNNYSGIMHYKRDPNGSYINKTDPVRITLPPSGEAAIYIRDENVGTGWGPGVENITVNGTEYAPSTILHHISSEWAEDTNYTGPTLSLPEEDADPWTGVFSSLPVTELKNDGRLVYQYRYYVVETGKTPSNSTVVYVDNNGEVVSDPSTLKTDTSGTQTVVNKVPNGALKLTKVVQVDGKVPTSEQYSNVDGDYIFKVESAAQVTSGETTAPAVTKYVQITVSNGIAASYKIADTKDGLSSAESIQGAWALVSDLDQGDYIITETEDRNLLLLTDIARGDGNTDVVDLENSRVTVHVTYADTTAAQADAQATFTNNYYNNDGQDRIALDIEKTFEGLLAENDLPDDFRVVISYSVPGNAEPIEIPLSKGQNETVEAGGEHIKIKGTTDGYTLGWHITNIPSNASDFKIKETGYDPVAGYTFTLATLDGTTITQTAGDWHDMSVTAPTAELSDVTNERRTSDSGQNVQFILEDGDILLSKLTANQGTLVISKESLNTVERAAVVKGWPQQGGFKTPPIYFSIEEHPDGFKYGGKEVTFGTNAAGKTIVTFTQNASAQEAVFAVSYDSHESLNNATLVNTYVQTPVTLEIIKVDGTDTTKLLKGAQFTLKKLDPEGTGEYLSGDAAVEKQSNVTENDGKASIAGITAGYYEISETATPAGYVKVDDGKFFIKVEHGEIKRIEKTSDDPVTTDVNEGKVKNWPEVTDNSGNIQFVSTRAAVPDDPATTGVDESAEAATTYKVGNTPGAALPSTGGRGITMFYVLGGCLICLAAALLFRRRCRA